MIYPLDDLSSPLNFFFMFHIIFNDDANSKTCKFNILLEVLISPLVPFKTEQISVKNTLPF